MFKVIYKGLETEFDTLDLAMNYAKVLDAFVTIKGNGLEVVGMFGADSIKDGLCPDGIEYSWVKRRNK